MKPPLRMAALGELLWDVLPEGQQLGGAPANLAAMSAALSVPTEDQVFLVSCVGRDKLGKQACEDLATHHVRLDYIASDPEHPTGRVTVALSAEAGPSYIIHEGVAWDYITESPALQALAPTLDAVCFGTLAQRSAVTRTTLRRLVEASKPDCLRVFDVNLREPYWTPEALLWGCTQATILKMNHEEVPHVALAVGAPAQEEKPLQVARYLLRRYPIQLVAITRGGHGSLLVTRDGIHDHPGIPAKVVDTIGAGDAFTAALTHYALRHSSLAVLAEAANRWGSWVATQRGGMPHVDADTRNTVTAAIEAARHA